MCLFKPDSGSQLIVAKPKTNSVLTDLDNSLSTGYAIPIENLVSFDSDETSVNSNQCDQSLHSNVLELSLPEETDAYPIIVSEE